MKIDGKKIAEEIVGKLKDMEISKKILAAVLVGENPQSESFLAQKKKTADELGIEILAFDFAVRATLVFPAEMRQRLERAHGHRGLANVFRSLLRHDRRVQGNFQGG